MHGMSLYEEIEYWRERAKDAEQQLAAMTAARDEACRIASGLDDGVLTYGGGYARGIQELRKVGAK